MMSPFRYMAGEEVLFGDRLVYCPRTDDRMATVVQIFTPGSLEAEMYSCKKTGGIMIEFDGGGLELISTLENEEDFELVARCGGV